MTISRRSFLALGAGSALALATDATAWSRLLAAAPAADWSRGPSAPWGLQEVYATVRDGEIVVAGGLRSGPDSRTRFETLAETAVLDPEAGAWRTGPDLPAPRHHLVLAAAGGTVYGFGGFVGESLRGGFRFRDDVFALEGGAWSRRARMPRRLGETVAARVGGRIHLVTGSLHPEDGAGGETGAHLVYDPATDDWAEARPAPTPRSSAAGAVLDGAIYVAGGRRRRGGFRNLAALERYDPSADRWEELRPLPEPSAGHAAAAVDGLLCCFGGERLGRRNPGVIGSARVYDPETDRWRELPPMPTPRHGLAAAAVDGRVYAVGGNTAPAVGAASSGVVEVLAVRGVA